MLVLAQRVENCEIDVGFRFAYDAFEDQSEKKK